MTDSFGDGPILAALNRRETERERVEEEAQTEGLYKLDDLFGQLRELMGDCRETCDQLPDPPVGLSRLISRIRVSEVDIVKAQDLVENAFPPPEPEE